MERQAVKFGGVKEIRLEQINTFNGGGGKSRRLSHFAHRAIKNKIINVAEELGVLVLLQSCTYRSQRCSGCGMVRKANRKKKEYSCKNCGLMLDADLNAALNHEIDLPSIPYALRQQELNRTGFFWKEEGFYDLVGQELTVPDIEEGY